ncbi:MAG: DUF4232 domain-containing protein [Corynebacterium sp.]|nr:DUF4232 domain-containing protein [Corynebacterium sp.]
MTKRSLLILCSAVLGCSLALGGCSKTLDPVKNTSASSNSTSNNAPSQELNKLQQTDPDQSICLANNLTATISAPNGTAGSSYYTVSLNNVGSACSLQGYPGVSLVDSLGNQIGAAADRDGADFNLVRLDKGDNAIFTVQISNAMAYGDCTVTSAAALKIYPPENRESITIPLRTQTCAEDSIHTMTTSAVK